MSHQILYYYFKQFHQVKTEDNLGLNIIKHSIINEKQVCFDLGFQLLRAHVVNGPVYTSDKPLVFKIEVKKYT